VCAYGSGNKVQMLRLAELKKTAHSHGEVHSCLRLNASPGNRDVNRRNAPLNGIRRVRFLSVAQRSRCIFSFPLSFFFLFFFSLFFYLDTRQLGRVYALERFIHRNYNSDT